VRIATSNRALSGCLEAHAHFGPFGSFGRVVVGHCWPVLGVFPAFDWVEKVSVCLFFGESPFVFDVLVNVRFVCGPSSELFFFVRCWAACAGCFTRLGGGAA
jgi:hypothetical protein